MADEPELRELYEGIEANEQEMARYREGLAPRLRGVRGRGLWLGLGLAAAAVVAMIVAWPSPEVARRASPELEARVGSVPEGQLPRLEARRLLDLGGGSGQRDARLIACLSHPDGSALAEAARGLVSDPRPEVRVFFLEYLLDHADGYQLNPNRIEAIMDRETDPLALELYGRLLGLSKRDGAAV